MTRPLCDPSKCSYSDKISSPNLINSLVSGLQSMLWQSLKTSAANTICGRRCSKETAVSFSRHSKWTGPKAPIMEVRKTFPPLVRVCHLSVSP